MEEEIGMLPEDKTFLSIDQVLPYIGEFKRFQWLVDAIFCFITIPATYQILITYFAALSPSYRCSTNSTECISNSTFPSTDIYRCSLPRTEWEYTEPKDFSVVTQFDIYCDNEWQIHLSTSILFVGWGIGAVVLGWVADNYGRKIVLFPSVYAVLITGMLTAFVPNMYVFMLCRFVVGFFTPGTGVQMFILISEFVGSKFRPLAGIMIWFFFSVALCILGMQAYLIRKWMILLIVCTVPYLIVIVFYKFIPESVRWLRLHGRIDEAMAVLQRAAEWNKRRIPKNISISEPIQNAAQHKSNPSDLFKTRQLTISILVQGYAWLINGMVYYGLSLAADDLGGSLYRNYVLLSAVEFPAIILAIFCCNWFGRKKTVMFSMLAGSTACVIVAFIPADGDAKIARILMGMIGKMFITLSFDAIYTWSVEIFPTNIRAEGMGFFTSYK